jgi:SAM-dependent methyltransferase
LFIHVHHLDYDPTSILTDAIDMPLITDELELLHSLVNLDQHPLIIELGCGAAQLSRNLLARFPACNVSALEVDERQHAKNLAKPQGGLHFLQAGAQEIPFAAERFNLALMLKSLHHIPLDLMDQALGEVWRVLRPGGLLYVLEPVFAGTHNEILRLFHDEEKVRAAALSALQRVVASGAWQQEAEVSFDMPVRYRDFADFEQRMIGVTYLNHRPDASTLAAVRSRFEQHMSTGGAYFERPTRVNLLRKLQD